MSNWKIGQKLVYIGRGMTNIIGESYGPKHNDTVTYDGMALISHRHIFLVEYKQVFDTQRASFAIEKFRPLQGELAKAELLSSFREVVEAPDCPINVPQTETS